MDYHCEISWQLDRCIAGGINSVISQKGFEDHVNNIASERDWWLET